MSEGNCDKVHFSSKKKAKAYILRFQNNGGRKRKNKIYKCESCGGYHFTSADSKTREMIKRVRSEIQNDN